jgi:DNA-binding CsgD family transcriptional regulator
MGMSAPTRDPLELEDYRRIFAFMEAVDRAPDLAAFQAAVLAALERLFGWRRLTFQVGPSLGEALDAPGPKLGYSDLVLEAYAERWGRFDIFKTAGTKRLLQARGALSLHELPHPTTTEGKLYVEQFMRPHRIANKAGFVIDAGGAGVAYVGAADGRDRRLGTREIASLARLRRLLAPLLRAHLEAAARARPQARLTQRERQVAGLVAHGLTNRQIAHDLAISDETVKKHLTSVLRKTGSTSRTQLAVRWSHGPPPLTSS